MEDPSEVVLGPRFGSYKQGLVAVYTATRTSDMAARLLGLCKKSPSFIVVQCIPVDYPFRFSDPVTPSPPAASGMA
jgi:hypothetical protein